MIEKIRNLIFPESLDSQIDESVMEPEVLVAAVLIEVAVIDGTFDQGERETISKLLEKSYMLDSLSINALIDEAKKQTERSNDLFGLIRKINSVFDHTERINLVEMLWRVVYSDGVVEDFEANIMRRLNGLLHVSDRESGEAKKRVMNLAS